MPLKILLILTKIPHQPNNLVEPMKTPTPKQLEALQCKVLMTLTKKKLPNLHQLMKVPTAMPMKILQSRVQMIIKKKHQPNNLMVPMKKPTLVQLEALPCKLLMTLTKKKSPILHQLNDPALLKKRATQVLLEVPLPTLK